MDNKRIAEIIDRRFINDIMAYAYNRTQGYAEAQDLCSDIIFEIIQSLGKENSIKNIKSYVWTIAANVYADYCVKRKRDDESLLYNTDEILNNIPLESQEEAEKEKKNI